ncbi:MAG: TlpA family protein disulfide reductase [Deltaproteobacteria bacterium]|nr:TlpA family protein disulfide reductase [Deltaproteobacteria bacterium]
MSTSTSTKALIGFLLAGTVGVIIFLFVHLSSDPGRPISIRSGKAAACTKGQKCLPEVSYTDTSGRVYGAKDLEGKVVIVNFWATWCKPCLKEIPDLSRVYEKYKDQGVIILGILTDNPDSSQLLNFQSDHDMSYPVVRSNSDIMVSFMYPESLPTTFIYDRGGREVFSRVGAVSEQALAQVLAPLVAQKR